MQHKRHYMAKDIIPITTKDVEARMLHLRGKLVLIDRDVAALYGVETKRVIEAVRNNPDKFPSGYCFSLQKAEAQQLVENFDRFKTMKHSISNHAFTERGLYMLATVLKSPRATQTTLAIIDTFVEVREMARTMEALQNVTDGGSEQQSLLQKTGQLLATVVGNNLSTASTETEIELNFAVVKIKHKFIRKDDENH